MSVPRPCTSSLQGIEGSDGCCCGADCETHVEEHTQSVDVGEGCLASCTEEVIVKLH